MSAAISVRDFRAGIADWLEIRRLFNHQESGLETNRRDVDLFDEFLHEHRIRKIRGQTLLDFMTWIATQRANCAGSINRKISSIRSYIRHLRFRQVRGADGFPIEQLARARQPYQGPLDAMEPEEVQRILQEIPRGTVLGERDYLLYSLLYGLGLRLGEALAIDLQDIDLQAETIRIHGKGRRERILPLTPSLLTLIERWGVLRRQIVRAAWSQALFLSKKGNRLSPRTVQDTFKKRVDRIGAFSVPRVTPHALRHAFASHALEHDTSDAQLIVLKHILGHELMQTTQRYVHPSMRILRAAVNDHPAAEILGQLIDEGVIALPMQRGRRKAM